MNSTYNTYVSSQLDNTKINKFIGRYISTLGGTGSEFQEFFRNLSFLQKHNYSFVVETDIHVMKFLLDESTRKFMCENFNNLRIIRVINIFDEPFITKSGFGTVPVFTFSQMSSNPKSKESYLICSNSTGFFNMPRNMVEFSTYDMSTNSYSQLNRISFENMVEHQYSFDFSDYHFEKPVKQQTQKRENTTQNEHKEKRRRVVNQ
jgi:hypothetical protein